MHENDKFQTNIAIFKQNSNWREKMLTIKLGDIIEIIKWRWSVEFQNKSKRNK